MSNNTILAMFSGGIDSTGVLHTLFTDKDFTSRPLIIHHVILQNREDRAAAELQAVEKIVRYYQAAYPQREFTYTDSIFNTMGFAPLQANRFPFDMDVCAFLAANICVARKDISHVAMGRTKTDIDSGGENFQQRMQRAQMIFRSVHALDARSIPEYIFPVINLTKLEIWQQLPPDIQAASWYCRHPRYDEKGSASACKVCPTCKEVADFINHD